jgi:hypothetical protein
MQGWEVAASALAKEAEGSAEVVVTSSEPGK